MRRRVARILVAAAAALLTSAPAAWADAAGDLAARYAPVVRLVAQEEPCAHGEPYQPTDVQAVLGNDEVALRGPWDTTNIVKVAPTDGELREGLFGYHLDFPGDALQPGCTYDEWSHRLAEASPPTMYARVATEAAQPGRLALQYWFFYVYNDFNNKHEGDWEMIQLDFAADTPEAALQGAPTEIGYSQHDGAERAGWGDDKLELVDGTHPVVHPAIGSHANYFGSALYLGRSAAQGVGCDDTAGDPNDLRPTLAVIPSDQPEAETAFPWLAYQGSWGEKHQAFYDGPRGPNTNTKWKTPLTWRDDTWRDDAFTVPTGESIGPAATDAFCGAVAAGSRVLTAYVNDPTPVLAILGGLLVLIVWMASRTRWDAEPFRVRRRRPWGTIVGSSLRVYVTHPRLFLGIGVLFLPLSIVITGLQYGIFRGPFLGALVNRAGESNAVVAGLAFAMGLFLTVLGLTIVQAATAVALTELDAGRPVTALDCYRRVADRAGGLLWAMLRAVIVVGFLEVIVFGFALAGYLLVRWSLLGQVVMLEDDPKPGLLRRCGELVSGRWWRTASIVVFVIGTGLLLGPLLGVLLLLLTSASFDFINLISGVVYLFTLPLAAIATTYLYFDLAVREEREEQREAAGTVLPAEA